ncbi:MAG: CinA family protein, partial [Victivallales bacterium]|nr:CinA family protein [Victivallales bacterium]
MRLTMICVGDELLKGFTVNTNLTELGAALLEEGIVPAEAVVIPDTRESIALELERQLASETDVIVFSGGLGPTLDDLTKQVVAETLGLRLEVNDEVLTKLAEYWKRRGSGTSLPTTAENQALVPKGAEWLPNDVGTAPGLVMKVKRRSSTKTAKKPLNHQLVVLLPGPPGEFNPMVRGHLMPYFKRNLRYDAKFTKTIIVADLPESKVENLTSKLVPDNMSIAYCASPAYVRLYLSGTSKNALDEKEREIREALGVHALPSGASSPVEMLLRELRGRKMTLAVAESCTGGLIGAEITSFSGASEVFKGGFI